MRATVQAGDTWRLRSEAGLGSVVGCRGLLGVCRPAMPLLPGKVSHTRLPPPSSYISTGGGGGGGVATAHARPQVVATHLLGDVPSPPLLGLMQGVLNNWRCVRRCLSFPGAMPVQYISTVSHFCRA